MFGKNYMFVHKGVVLYIFDVFIFMSFGSLMSPKEVGRYGLECT